ncbi:hypothetical protein BT93_C1852 [Corymbia citriodora subsp. variegata]|nr:hypothetical protein BT93_C1852 [Corymbia citriodora subsp. variegata]
MGLFVHGDVGTAASYEPPYTLSSGESVRGGERRLWDNGAACGRRYRLRCLSGSNRPCKDGTVDVTVVDYCRKSPCPSTILLSTSAFSAISKSPSAKINAEYIQ